MTIEDLERLQRLQKALGDDADRLRRLQVALESVRAINGSPDLEKALVQAIFELETYGQTSSYGGTD